MKIKKPYLKVKEVGCFCKPGWLLFTGTRFVRAIVILYGILTLRGCRKLAYSVFCHRDRSGKILLALLLFSFNGYFMGIAVLCQTLLEEFRYILPLLWANFCKCAPLNTNQNCFCLIAGILLFCRKIGTTPAPFSPNETENVRC